MSLSDGSSALATSSSSESASETGGQGERDRVGEFDLWVGEIFTRRKLCSAS